MYKNYFFLNRLALELNETLKDYTVTEAYSQEKDKLVLQAVKNGFFLYVELSVSSAMPYILVKQNLNRARKNTISFFTGFLPFKISEVLIAENERILLFRGEEKSLFYFIRGNNSNIFAESNSDEIFTFRNCSDELKTLTNNDLHNALYINHFYVPDFEDMESLNFEVSLKQNYPTVSKDILREVNFRSQNKPGSGLKTEILTLIEEIRTAAPVVLFNENTKDILLTVNTYTSFPFTDKKEFAGINEALGYYFGKKYFLEKFTVRKRAIEHYFKRELPKLTAKLDNLKKRLDTPSREAEYNNKANLLLINIKKIMRGMKEISLEDIYNDAQSIKITLDESLSPKDNVDLYFRKSKSERVGIEKANALYTSLYKEFKRLKTAEQTFLTTNKIEDYEALMKELKINPAENAGKNNEEKFNFKQYVIDKKYNVYVGKDSANNDLLTTRFAKQNDFWFHARSVPGSHVVLRVENTKEAVPKSVLKSAAALAAFHSKAKTASTAPVSYTLKKYVYKKKGMNPGQVALTKEDVLLVKPEIPSNCEYVTGE